MEPLQIERFKDLTSLVAEKDRLHEDHEDWQKRQDTLREFYNGRPIATETEADEENLEEITNHLIGYSNMQVTETRLYSLWSTSNKFVDVNVVHEDMNVDDREKTSSHINKYLNRAIYRTTRFGAFCRSVSGEISLAGRAACFHKEDADWCPSVIPKLYLPDNVGTDASELTYAFAPRELTYAQLEEMRQESQADTEEEEDDDVDDEAIGNSVEIDVEVVEQLMATIDEQVQMTGSPLHEGNENANHKPTNDDGPEKSNRTTVNVWYYFEVRFDEQADSKVVDLLIFSDEFRAKADGAESENTSTHTVVAYYPAYYENPTQWLNLIVIDASIGGDKRFSTAKGIAEITYNSDIDSEELLNAIYAGEKLRAQPRFQEGPNTNEERMLGWNPHEDTLVPQGVEQFQIGGGTGGLNNPLALFQQLSARQSNAGFSNTERGGELRTQSLERQANSNAAQNSRIADLYKSMEIIAQEMVRRFFVGEIEGGSPGYEEIMWFRHQMEKRDINVEELAEQVFGVFEHIEVRIVKSSTSGEIDHDLVVAERLMQNLQHLPAAIRPRVVNKFIAIITGDQDFADSLVEMMPKISNAQQVSAESEFEQIKRDASLGLATPLNQDDVHIDHIITHNKHLQAKINDNQMVPWDRRDASHFTGIQVHQQAHFEEALANDASRAEAEIQLRAFQELVAEGNQLLNEVSRRELEDQGLSEQEVEMQIKLREQARKERETEIKALDTQSVVQNREDRRADVRRKGDQQFLIQKQQVENQSQQQPQP